MTKKIIITEFKVSDPLGKKFAQFVEYAAPKRLGRNLRQLLLWYLIYENDAPAFDLQDMANDLVLLFELLDMAEEEKIV